MKKTRLYGIKKDNGRTQFIIEKSEDARKLIERIINYLTKDETTPNIFMGCGKIKSYTDWCIYDRYKDHQFEVFIGKNRIIFVVFTDNKNQKRLVNEVIKFCKWYKTK